jgi:2-amino-4-hydroxy-6-hydroxymethyldihydropteridine diphosphokinase
VNTVAQQLRQCEAEHGRSREAEKKFAVSLDLDLLLYGDLILNEDDLQIPRAEIESCAFVLQPLAEIAPQLTHPISCKCYGGLWQQFDKTHLQQRRVV